MGQARAAQWMLSASIPCFAALALMPSAWGLGLVLAVSEFTGLVWNTVSVATRQRMIPDRLLGRVNSAYRLLAWGMMPVGLIASGALVRLGEGLIGRPAALTLPFWVAAAGIGIVTLIGWRPLGRGLGR